MPVYKQNDWAVNVSAGVTRVKPDAVDVWSFPFLYELIKLLKQDFTLFADVGEANAYPIWFM